MLHETLKTEKGRFLLSHLHNCEKCYNSWVKEANSISQGKAVKRLEEILNTNHSGNIV